MPDLTDHSRYAEFKHQLWLTVSAMEKTIKRSYPRVGTWGSQYGEFEVLRELLPELTGCYVEVGANAPVECSMTWEFYQLGWRGLLVECLPSCWHSLLLQRPGDYLSPIAASNRPGFAKLRMANAVSSINPDWDIEESADLIVECCPLDDIMDQYPGIKANCSLLSIDVEGAEEEVLEGISWTRFKPKVIVIESYQYHPDGPVEKLYEQWEHLLPSEYDLHFENQLNRIYVRK